MRDRKRVWRASAEGIFFRTYPCPCGDRFLITPEELEFGEEVATCPSCSLIVRVIYDEDSIPVRRRIKNGLVYSGTVT